MAAGGSDNCMAEGRASENPFASSNARDRVVAVGTRDLPGWEGGGKTALAHYSSEHYFSVR